MQKNNKRRIILKTVFAVVFLIISLFIFFGPMHLLAEEESFFHDGAGTYAVEINRDTLSVGQRFAA